MNKFILLADSASDLDLKTISKYNMELVGLKCLFNDKEYIEDSTINLSYKEFYDGIRNGALPSTSQVNMFSFYEMFEKYAKQNISIIYPAFSSALSGTINGAILAKKDILEKYPDADITIIDTKCASLGCGLVLVKAAKLQQQGATKKDIIKYILDICPNMNHLVLLNDLNYLKRGGRLSGTAATIGSILQLKPLVKMNDNGELINYSKVKGRKKGLSTLFKSFEESAVDIEKQDVIAISHSDCLEDANKLADMIKSKYNVEIIINYIGFVIGSHTGAGTIAFFFLGNGR